MCTAISFRSYDHYFGRNLDLHHHYNEAVIITPGSFKFRFVDGESVAAQYPMIGIGMVMDQYPLYYDAVNAFGLCIAALNFPGNAVYHPIADDKKNVASYELIPWLLSCCKSVGQAKKRLQDVNITNDSFSSAFPPSPLHWFICDKDASITVESVDTGLKIYENPVGVLTNNPPFPYHLHNLCNYLNITSQEPSNRFSDALELKPYSFGMGGMGLPGDLSSASRFVRAAFTKENAVCNEDEESSVSQFFHILDSVSQTCGCVRFPEGFEKTVYSCCCNSTKGIYYYKTYDNSQICSVKLGSAHQESNALEIYPLRWKQQLYYEQEHAPSQ